MHQPYKGLKHSLPFARSVTDPEIQQMQINANNLTYPDLSVEHE